jgi:acetyl esterase
VLAWHTPGTASYVEFAEGFPSRKRMEEILGMYFQREDTSNPLAFPLNARDLSGLPPALIFAAERDVLRDEAEQYGARLLAAGYGVLTLHQPLALQSRQKPGVQTRPGSAD